MYTFWDGLVAEFLKIFGEIWSGKVDFHVVDVGKAGGGWFVGRFRRSKIFRFPLKIMISEQNGDSLALGNRPKGSGEVPGGCRVGI